MKGGGGRRESGAQGSRGEGDWVSTRRGGGGRGGGSEVGCASAASGDLRSGAPHTILSYPILS